MSESLYEQGLAIRKKVVGAEAVEKVLQNTDAFAMPMQELTTEFCWGKIWSRPALPHKTRSMLNVAMLVALNRPQELRLHIRGAINNGCTKEEIQEVLLQTAIYCGIPAGQEGFRAAREVFAEQNA